MTVSRRASLLAGLAALSALAIGGAFIKLVETRRAETRRAAADEAVATQLHSLEGEIARSLAPGHVAAAVLRHARRIERFRDFASVVGETQGVVGTLALAPGGVVKEALPASAGLLGFDLLHDPLSRDVAREARESRRVRLVGPLNLVGGAPTLMGLLPVFLAGAGSEEFWGFVVVPIGLRELMAATRIEELVRKGYQYELSTSRPTSRRRVMLARSGEIELQDPVQAQVSVADAALALAVAPRVGSRTPSLLATQVVLVLVAALVAGVSVHRLLQEPEQLREEAAVRRRRLSEAHLQIHAEMTQRQEAEERLRHEAVHDLLTGLPNRASLLAQVQAALDFAGRQPGLRIGLLLLDVDRFKYVNESLGHAAGDTLLVALAQRLAGALRPGDVLARVGGDEFAVVLLDVQGAEGATGVADRLLRAMKGSFGIEGQEVFAMVSMGIVVSGPDYAQAEDLLRDADTAMHRAKSQGRARHTVFDAAMRSRVVKLLQLETDLRRAIERNEFIVYYQPIVDLATGRVGGFEALVRWRHPERGFVSPGDFMPLAEETGLVIWIDRWVLGEASRRMREWQGRLGNAEKLFVSVNVSRRQLAQPLLVDYVAQTVLDSGLDFASLKLEITESAVMENAEAAAEILEQLREIGVRLSIDDFGTGYSSLSQLGRFPFHTVKIDQSFIKGKLSTERDVAIVRTILRLASSLGMDVIAEGVETAEELARLRELGCGSAQGYWFSRPLASENLEQLLSSAPSW